MQQRCTTRSRISENQRESARISENQRALECWSDRAGETASWCAGERVRGHARQGALSRCELGTVANIVGQVERRDFRLKRDHSLLPSQVRFSPASPSEGPPSSQHKPAPAWVSEGARTCGQSRSRLYGCLFDSATSGLRIDASLRIGRSTWSRTATGSASPPVWGVLGCAWGIMLGLVAEKGAHEW
jgi:hypothetical protein